MSGKNKVTAVEFLNQATNLDQKIGEKLRLVRVLRDQATSVSQTLSSVRVTHSRDTSRLQRQLAAALDVEEMIMEDYKKLQRLRADIYMVIRALPDDSVRHAMELRYVACFPVLRAAQEMQYDERTVYRLLRKGEKLIDERFDLYETGAQVKQ